MIRLRLNLKCLLAAAALAPSLARAQHGDGIGSGGGSAENNVIYAYQLVPDAVSTCLNLWQACGIKRSELPLLKSILEIAADRPGTAQRIRFIRSGDDGITFDLGRDEPHRLSRTSLSADAPVWWNRDQLYDAYNGQVLNGVTVLISQWIHELGHQTGEELRIQREGGDQATVVSRLAEEHALYMSLGARVAAFFERSARSNVQRTLDYPEGSVVAFNLGATKSSAMANGDYDPSEVSVGQHSELAYMDGAAATSLTELVRPSLTCDSGEAPEGWRIENPYWNSPGVETLNRGGWGLKLKAWLRVRCASADRSGSITSLKGLEFEIVFGYADVAGGERPRPTVVRGPSDLQVLLKFSSPPLNGGRR